jgi:outer membrane receptor protein involved in Fe transport
MLPIQIAAHVRAVDLSALPEEVVMVGMMRSRFFIFSLSLLAGSFAAPLPAAAQVPATAPQATTSISGTILDAQRHPLAGVVVELSGPASGKTTTNGGGVYSFANIIPGVYRLTFTKPGFTPASQDNLATIAGAATKANVQMQEAQFSSIREIGRVSVSSGARTAINTSTAAVSTVSGDTFIEQGQLTVNRTLDEIPGLSIGIGSGFAGDQIANGASPLVTGIPSIRGALPYETASLIDGHPISIGVYGTFNPAILSPYDFQDVEVVKGPGASAPNINYAIGGTVNFRTLEPTRDNHVSFDAGTDQFGGNNANLRATGSLDGGKIGYAFDYATQGTQGPDRGYSPEDPLNLSNGAIINGQVACGSAAAQAAGACFPSVVPIPNTNFAAQANLTAPLLLCCPNIPLESSAIHELAKVRYNFSPSTALTFSYLGGQLKGSSLAADLFLYPSYFFGPPAGYSSTAYPAGFPVFQNDQGPSQLQTNANLYQGDFHTALGAITLNARYYVSGDSDANLQYPNNGTQTLSGTLYGGVPLGPTATTPTIFTGQEGTVTLLNSYVGTRTHDTLHGYTIEGDLPVGNNVYSLSYDAIHTESSANTMYSFPSEDNVSVQPGSGQHFETIMARGQFQLRPTVDATLSNYLISYTDHYTQDGGVTFDSSTHAYDAPRLALSWRPERDTAVRASTGFSIAPPYIDLLTNQSTATPDRTPPTSFSETGNAGDVAPETAFGFDLGADQRVKGTVISGDVYETTLHNQFLSQTSLNGTYTAAPGNPYGAVPGQQYPLYVTQTQNLGHSRYEGIELAVHKDPVFGFGYRVQGYLQRAYAYDLPAGFYNTAAGPNTANLGILPGENFGTTGQGYNGLSQSRVPYSGGYAEINNRFRNGAYFLMGVTYYGPNNAYNEPPFGVVNLSFRQPVTKRAYLQFSVVNLTAAYPAFQYNIYGGIPTPLVNGELGFTAGNVIGPTNASLMFHYGL